MEVRCTSASRLQMAAARFEILRPQTIKAMADPSWIHLGEQPVAWQERLTNEFKAGHWLNCGRVIYRQVKPRYTSEQLKSFYDNTDFRPFRYEIGDRFEFQDNSFDFIYAEHFYEHLFMDEAVELLKECRRILKPHGVIRIVVPDADLRQYAKPEPLGFPSSKMSWLHPDKHKTRWSVYALQIAIQSADLFPRPITFADKFGNLNDSLPEKSDPDYLGVNDEFIFSKDYIRRKNSLICDGIKKPS
jgi:SAM-dependent methyltransferase